MKKIIKKNKFIFFIFNLYIFIIISLPYKFSNSKHLNLRHANHIPKKQTSISSLFQCIYFPSDISVHQRLWIYAHRKIDFTKGSKIHSYYFILTPNKNKHHIQFCVYIKKQKSCSYVYVLSNLIILFILLSYSYVAFVFYIVTTI